MSGDSQCALVDLRHGIVAFFGSNAELEERIQSLLAKSWNPQLSREVKESLRIVSQAEVGKEEFEYMLSNRRAPRRVVMRLSAKAGK